MTAERLERQAPGLPRRLWYGNMGRIATVSWVMATKTTVDIREPLLDAARDAASEEGTSLRALIEEGLELALAKRRKQKPFKLRRASFKGKGVRSGVREGEWSEIAAAIYEGRGE